MDLIQLKEYLNKLKEELEHGDKKFLEDKLSSLVSVFPFNEYEYILIFLKDREIITFEKYEKLRNNYVSTNKYLSLFEMAPRVFGQVWGEEHLRSIDSRFKEVSKELDKAFDGEYDVWFEGIKLEVKACRAINTEKRGSLVSKALHYASKEPFWMNFQQLKADACSVFIFIGVWVDLIVYWVLSSKDVKENKYLSHQHRGGVEYQIGITDRNISDFERYRVPASKIAETVLAKARGVK